MAVPAGAGPAETRPEARLNRPGTVTGNWSWRLPLQALTGELAARYRELVQLHNRG